MMSLDGRMKRYTIIVTVIIVVLIMGYLLTSFKPQFLGLIIGLAFSYLSLWTTFRKAKVIGEVASGLNKFSMFSYTIAGFGVLIRFGLAILCVWLAITYPNQLHLISVIAGFALIYVIIMADILIESGRKR
ncbi:ATP synthase subunit I [Halalkalibacter akibai]|uniref:ATP synthase protein I n=1 Tax=Halalkalibacter akibai (strain ATCC 43226 / DSM 21942 / CIP 109018 / JCM 9157 / 1139) TaxID=1236973 RepID=W4QNE5_HALA3|nr:ATP synthase subunit I [Halalkalibacter akibai]GAE33635.1 ATP synthase protein I [Halalkalibacter akibai JCM 9157]